MKAKSWRTYIFTGLIVWLPLIITFLVIRFIINILDSGIRLLPHAYQPEQWLGYSIPGLGLILFLILLISTGILVKHFLGQRLINLAEHYLSKIPLVRTIYNGSKQIIQGVFSTNSQAFRKVLLVEYPRKGMWTMGFLTGNGTAEITANIGEEIVSFFIPTTPNPTSGFLLLVPKSKTIELMMPVEEALKYIISLGVVPVQNDILITATENKE